MPGITQGAAFQPESSLAAQIATMQAAGAKAATTLTVAAQADSAADFQSSQITDDAAEAGSLRVQLKQAQESAKKLEDRKSIKEALKGKETARIKPIGKIKQSAGELNKRNPDLKPDTLELLWDKIQPGDTKEVILQKVLEVYSDPVQADGALEFLLNTTEGPLREAVQAAKNEHYNANRNVLEPPATEEGPVDTQQAALTLSNFEDIKKFLSDQPDSQALFNKLEQQAGNFKEQRPIITKILNRLGDQLKIKGDGIEKGELNALLKQIRFLQTHLGVYAFFRGRMSLIQNEIIRLNNAHRQSA